MNILFLVMNFLLIFMFLNAAVLKNAAFSSSQKTSACSYLSSKLNLQSKWERYKYQSYLKSIKKEKTTKSLVGSSSKKIGTFHSHRMKENIPSLGKWNLETLLSADPYNSFLLGKITGNLLKELYGHTPFWKETEKEFPNLAETLVHDFFDKKDKVITLSDLFPEEERLQKMFYKMLKGSGTYDLTKKEGYPPLEDFFTLHSQEKTITSFHHTSHLILRAIFQDPTVESILSLEKKKWEKDQYLHSLTKEELKSLCQDKSLNVLGKRFQDIEPFLHFSHKKAKLEKLTFQDKKTHLHLEMPLPKQPN